MKRFIAYFDLLGYKDFILNNNNDHLRLRVSQILRDVELSLGQGKFLPPKNGIIVADLSQTRINCLNISDTIIFWTNDDSIESLEELLLVAYTFNWRQVLYNFPIRGIIYFDEMAMLNGQNKNKAGAVYSINSIYGKGLAKAHLKCESLNWSGSIIDETVINQIENIENVSEFLTPFAKPYLIPYKKPIDSQKEEYALLLSIGQLNELSYSNTKKGIIDTFKSDNKSVDSDRVQEILSNTISYLDTFKE